MGKRANPRLIKANLTYTIEEAAIALNVSVQTVRSWGKKGLKIMKSMRPYLISGSVLREFLEQYQQKSKQPLKDDELYCMNCRRPTTPYADLADYEPKTETNGTLIGLCGTCGNLCHRFANPTQVEKSKAYLEITIRGGE